MIGTETDAEIAHNLFNGLVRYDNTMNVVPDIAMRLPTIAADGQTYIFNLRKDVTFWNGDKVTAKDVVYSWNRAAAMQGPFAVDLSAIAGYDAVAGNQIQGPALEGLLEKQDPSVTMSGVSAPDDYTLVVKLSSAAGWFLPAIAQPAVAAMVVDRNVIKADFDHWWSKPETLVGTGAFKMSAHSANQSADFVTVPNWWGTPSPTLTKVHVDVLADARLAIARYEQGKFDVLGYGAFSAPASELARIKSSASEKSELVLETDNKTYWVNFNMVGDASRRAGGPFTMDQGKPAHDLRLAFALAVDKTRLAKDLCSNLICAPATGGLIPKGLLGYLGDGADPLAAYDPVRARSLLEAADPTGSKTKGLVYTYDPENPFNEPTAKLLQSQWLANLGVSVGLQSVPHTIFITSRLRGAYVLSRDGWTGEYNDPQAWFGNLWGATAGCPDTFCSSGYDTKAYDQLLAKADAEPLAQAILDYNALGRQLIDDVVYVPLYYTVGAFLIKPYVRGAGANNLFDYDWNQVQITSH
jgi:ABC-type oligopeptide transport system substrate-binding subunit